MIADGTKTYARSDALGPISEGKKWLEFDISGRGSKFGLHGSRSGLGRRKV